MSAGSLAHVDLSGPPGRSRMADAGVFFTPAIALVAALTALAAVLRFYGLGHQGFWYDEANTALLVHYSPGNMLGLIPQSESTPPFYYCVAWVWARVFGSDEAGLRSLSALAGVLVVPVAYGAAAKLVSRRAGVIVAALTACSPLLIWYSQEARSYELLVLLCAGSLLAFASALNDPRAALLTAWALVSALALATHYYAVLAVVPEAAWLLLAHRTRRGAWMAVGVVAACGLALIPLAISQNGTGKDAWIAHAPLGPRLRQMIPQFLIGTGAPARPVLKYVAMALALGGLALLAVRPSARRGAASVWRRAAPGRRGALVAGGLALGGAVLALALLAVGFDDLITRNILPLWLPVAIVLGAGLAAGGRLHLLGATVAVALCAIGITAAIGVAADRNLQRPDWRPVARALAPRPAVSRAILIQHYRYRLPLALYLPRLERMEHPARVSELDVISFSAPPQPLCWWGAACNLIPSVLQPRYAIPGFHELWRRRVLQFTIVRLAARHPVELTRPIVAAALHTTRLDHDELLYQPG